MSAIEPPDNLLEIRNATMRVSRIESNTQTMTANLEVGTTLAVSGNTTLSSNLVVGGNVSVGTANLFVDTVSSNVGVGTNLPLAKLDVKGDIGLVGNIYSDSNLSVQYTTENPSNTWAQVGGDFFGETASDRLGFSVAISADGLRIALGEYKHNSNAGRVIVFDWNGSAWIQAGTDIDGSGEFGTGVSLSSDGTRVVVGAPGTTNGSAKVYDWNGSAWVQVGGDLTGTASGDLFGFVVSISGDKTRIVVGARGHDSSRGEVKIYEYHQGSATWVQLGSTLDGEATGDRFGFSTAMSSNGSRVAIGADKNDAGGTDAGHVRVFDWNGSAWVQVGTDIDSESAGDLMGARRTLSLSSDGLRLAVGARRDDETGTDAGHARVFDWNGTAWVQVGTDIDGEAAGDEFGNSVALSPDGSRLAVGGIFNDAGGSNAGHARVFEYIGGSWTQIGADLDGNDPSGLFGTAVALSSNGSRLVVGGPRVDGPGGSECGLVRVFDYDGVLKTKQIIKEDIVEIPGDLRAGCPVFLNAMKNSNISVPADPGSVITWDNLISSKGGGYEPSTGIFTAPLAGYYRIYIFGSSANGTAIWIYLYLYSLPVAQDALQNQNVIARVYSTTGTAYRSIGSIEQILYLNVGDRIVARTRGQNSIFQGERNSFSINYFSK